MDMSMSFENNDPFAPWNNPMKKDDPFMPHNNPMRRDNPFEEWNSPIGRKENLSREDRIKYGERFYDEER